MSIHGPTYIYSGPGVWPDSADSENLCAVDVVTENEDVVKSFKSCHYSGPAFFDTPPNTKVLLRYQDPIQLQKVKNEFDPAKRAVT